MGIDASVCLTNHELRVTERENTGSAASLDGLHGENIIRNTDKLNNPYELVGDGLPLEMNSAIAMQNTKNTLHRIGMSIFFPPCRPLQ